MRGEQHVQGFHGRIFQRRRPRRVLRGVVASADEPVAPPLADWPRERTLWPFLIFKNEVGLLSFIGLIAGAVSGHLYFMARLRLPRLTISDDGIRIQRSILNSGVYVRRDEIDDLDQDHHDSSYDSQIPRQPRASLSLVRHKRGDIDPTPQRCRPCWPRS